MLEALTDAREDNDAQHPAKGGASLPLAVPPRKLAYTAEANAPNAKRFSSILVQLLQEGKLNAIDLKKSTIPKLLANKYMLTNCFELAQKVISKKEQATLTDKKSTHDERLAAACSIETKSFEKMLEYEGLDPAIEKKMSSQGRPLRCWG